MTRTRYVPILKGKLGELDALRDVSMSTRHAMIPLVELVSDQPDEDVDVARLAKDCEQLITRLESRYQNAIMLDAGLVDLGASLAGGRSAVELLARLARARSVTSQPVVRLGDPDLAIEDARDACRADGRGVSIRLVGEDVDEDPDDLDGMLLDLLHRLGVEPSGADLILDLGAVDGDVAVRGGARLVTSLVRDLPSIGQWRTVTVASGAFPVDLSQFNAWVPGERPRYDAQLWDQVHRRKLPRALDYGDYAIAHPTLGAGAPFSPPPQLRYTVSEHWVVLKGRRNDPQGNAQFHRICRVIASQPEFVGAPLGKADARIAAESPEGPGNGTTWRSIGTAHHLDYVARRLTTLGEP